MPRPAPAPAPAPATHPASAPLAATLLAPALLLAACSDGVESDPVTTIGASLDALGFRALADAVAAAELDDDLSGPGPFTLFAPTDQAFAALPAGQFAALLDPANQATTVGLLLFHALGSERDSASLVAGPDPTPLQGTDLIVDSVLDGLYVNEARVLVGNIEADNGLVHGIDRVLRPGGTLLETLAARDLDALAAALDAAGLTATLQGPGPFTLFAPTDAALAAATDLDGLTQEELAERLSYHLVDGALRASALVAAGTVPSLDTAGNTLQLGLTASTVTVDGVALELFNVPCTNGVVHVIGEVLTPPVVAPASHGGGADFADLDASTTLPTPGAGDPRASVRREGAELVFALAEGPRPTGVELWLGGVGALPAGDRARLGGEAPDLAHTVGEAFRAVLWHEPAGHPAALELRVPAAGLERARLVWMH